VIGSRRGEGRGGEGSIWVTRDKVPDADREKHNTRHTQEKRLHTHTLRNADTDTLK
jgi:hypothetical protein